MASSMAAMTMPRSIAFSRATASAICSSSSLLALTAIVSLLLRSRGRSAAGWVMSATLVAAVWMLIGRYGCFALLRRAGLRLFLAQGGGDQLVSQHELGFADVVHGKRDGRAIDVDADGVAFNGGNRSAEALAALDRHGHLDLHDLTQRALEVAA